MTRCLPEQAIATAILDPIFVERFHKKIDRDGPVVRAELGPCWLWKACVDGRGYGVIRRSGLNLRSHRVALSLAIGRAMSPEEHALHRCDTPICCNPSHLLVGTHAENIADRDAKGRLCHGERHKSAKLKGCDVAEIIRRCEDGETRSSVARRFGVAAQNVSRIVRGKNWRRLADKVTR